MSALFCRFNDQVCSVSKVKDSISNFSSCWGKCLFSGDSRSLIVIYRAETSLGITQTTAMAGRGLKRQSLRSLVEGKLDLLVLLFAD